MTTQDERSPYTVTINEIPHTMLLRPEHAEHYGDAAVPLDEGSIDPPPARKTPDRKGAPHA